MPYLKSEVSGMTVTEVKGFGRQNGHTELYRVVDVTECGLETDPEFTANR